MKRVLLAMVMCAVAVSACGSDDGAGGAEAGTILVRGAWARVTAVAQTTGAVYFEIESDVDDTLFAASVADDVAAGAELHEAVPAEMSDPMSGDASVHDMGAMTMREVSGGVALPAHQRLQFEPGGYHVMLLDLAAPLAAGGRFDMTLQFDHADPVVVQVVVAETAP